MADNLNTISQSVTTSVSKKPNLTSIKWAHAVNSVHQLKETLISDVDMIESDVLLGHLFGKDEIIPIMAHPPNMTSDLSLSDFLQKVEAHNATCAKCNMKGIKLDFKSIEAFETALKTEKTQLIQTKYPVWLNADIIDGPCGVNNQVAVDAKRFLTGCLQFTNAVLSIGWTTDADATYKNGVYSKTEIDAMILSIYNNNVTNSITFPVRAGIAANSIQQLNELICKINKTHKATLTIWSSPGDHVDIKRLEKLISCIGVNCIYLDVPIELYNQLKIVNKETK